MGDPTPTPARPRTLSYQSTARPTSGLMLAYASSFLVLALSTIGLMAFRVVTSPMFWPQGGSFVAPVALAWAAVVYTGCAWALGAGWAGLVTLLERRGFERRRHAWLAAVAGGLTWSPLPLYFRFLAQPDKHNVLFLLALAVSSALFVATVRLAVRRSPALT